MRACWIIGDSPTGGAHPEPDPTNKLSIGVSRCRTERTAQGAVHAWAVTAAPATAEEPTPHIRSFSRQARSSYADFTFALRHRLSQHCSGPSRSTSATPRPGWTGHPRLLRPVRAWLSTVPEAGRTMFAIASSSTTIRRMPQPTAAQESASSSGSAVHSHLGWQGRCEGGHGLFHEGDDPVPVPADLHHRRPHPERRSCRGRRPSAPCAGALSPPAAQPAQPLTTTMTAVQPICRASVNPKHCTCAPDASTAIKKRLAMSIVRAGPADYALPARADRCAGSSPQSRRGPWRR